MNIARTSSSHSPDQALAAVASDQAPAGEAQGEGSAQFPLAQLPDDMLPEIFSHLDVASRQALASSNKALRDVFRFRETALALPGNKLAEALEKYPNIERITIRGPLDPEALADIAGPAVLLYGLAPRRAGQALSQLKEARA